ncbi:MAG: ABC transporter permease [Clostridia bacterium]|nr:ABC transporter permease [Clostridia bacterium]
MNKVLKKLRSRNIKGNIKQFLSVIFIVLLATMLFSGFMTNSHTLNSSIDNYFEKTNLADLWVHTDKVTEEDEKFLIDNDIEFNKRFYFEAVAEIKSLKITNAVKVYVCKAEISEPYSGICNPYIESGKASAGYGCLLDKNVAKNNDIRAGLESILFSCTFDVNGEPLTLDFEERLTGTMSLDECADSYATWSLVIEEEMFLSHIKEKLMKVDGVDYENFEIPYNQLLIKTDDVQKTKELLKDYYLNESTESELLYLFGRESIESVKLLTQEVRQSRKMIYVFPIIFLIVAVLIILTTIDQLIIQERKRIGILKCAGVPNKKILKHYSKYGSSLCFFGSVVGTILGVLLIPEIMFSRYGAIYSIPEEYVKLQIPVWWLVLMVVTMVVLGYVVSLSRCYSILNKNPIECLKYDQLGSSRKLKKKNKNKYFKKLPISLKMAIRNIQIKPLRTVMATIGITGCVALLVAGFGIGDTLSKSVSNDYGRLFKYDVSTTYNTENFKEKLAEDERISYVEDYSKVFVELEFGEKRQDIYLYSIQKDSKISKIKLQTGDVCISKSTAKSLGVGIGDEINIRVAEKEQKLKITKLVETTILNGLYVCDDYDFADEFVSRGVFIKCDSDASDVAEFVNNINGTNTAKTMKEERANIEERIMSTSAMTTTIKIFAVLLAVVVLLNLVFLIVKERNIELATLKVMGLDSWQVSISVILEVSFMAAIGIILGLFAGYPLMLWILAVNKIQIINYVSTISFLSFFASILIVLITIFAVLVVCYLRIRKINMAESLKRID